MPALCNLHAGPSWPLTSKASLAHMMRTVVRWLLPNYIGCQLATCHCFAAVICPSDCAACTRSASGSNCTQCNAGFALKPSGSCGGWRQASMRSKCSVHHACWPLNKQGFANILQTGPLLSSRLLVTACGRLQLITHFTLNPNTEFICPDHCDTCARNGFCTKCAQGYFLQRNGVCGGSQQHQGECA